MSTRKSPSRRNVVRPLLLTLGFALLLACVVPAAFARHRKKVDDATPAGLSALVSRIHDNSVRIDQLSFIFEAPGYPRHNPVRAALIRENEDLFLRVQQAAGKLLEPIRKEPPPGQLAWWQLLRDTESGARDARLQGWWDFRDSSIRRRWAEFVRPAPKDREKPKDTHTAQ